jgi:hypothetical protein
MIVPQYWAEARAQHRQGGRQMTVRRFGWSDDSQDEAQRNADQRAQDALKRLASGEKLVRREPKIPYNGAEGVPIREEIVARHGATIITRNGYGARCLNTPDVLFVDIDFTEEASLVATFAVFAAIASAGVAIWFAQYKLIGALTVLFAFTFSGSIAAALRRIFHGIRGGVEHLARSRIERFLRSHPDWSLRIYRTPAGMRVLATQRLFQPDEPAVADCFRALGADPVFVRMCLNQRCFRARVSPKPWRIGIAQHMRPRPGVWPVSNERMPARNGWIAQYETAAEAYSACKLIDTAGSGIVDPEVRRVIELHDTLCRANTQLPMA